MARKHLWTVEELKKMADEIAEKKTQNPKYSAKDYASEKNIVYGTLYQRLCANGLFVPTRVRVKKIKQETEIPTAE
jgi:hypothetical protein